MSLQGSVMLQEGVASCEDGMIQDYGTSGGQHYGESRGEWTGQTVSATAQQF